MSKNHKYIFKKNYCLLKFKILNNYKERKKILAPNRFVNPSLEVGTS